MKTKTSIHTWVGEVDPNKRENIRLLGAECRQQNAPTRPAEPSSKKTERQSLVFDAILSAVTDFGEGIRLR
jgi:hypothetical protein